MKRFVVVGLLLAPRLAAAAEPESVDDDDDDARGALRTRASEVSFDTRQKRLELSGDVQVDASPFHLRSDRIVLTRTKLGVEIDGAGTLAFCPCLGTPLTVDFTAALVAPPGDIVLTDPKLRVFGLPVFYLPYFWLRSDDKPGVLPPDLAYRGQDGVFVGEGVHLPFLTGAGKNAIDLRAGAYLFDGFAADARLRTPVSFARVRYDRRPGSSSPILGAGTSGGADDGLLVDARGASHGVAWDVDALRGRRGVAATSDLDAAAKPWDRATGEAALRAGPFALDTRLRVVSRRGGGTADFDMVGPVAAIRTSDALAGKGPSAPAIGWDATVEGGSLRSPGMTTSFARAEVGGSGQAHLGPALASLGARAELDVYRERETRGTDRALQARAHVGVPLVRAYETTTHLVEPFAEAAVLHVDGASYVAGVPSVLGTAPLAEGGVRTSLGSWATRDAMELSVSGGARLDDPAPLARARLSASAGYVGAFFDGGLAADGIAFAARGRLGAREALHLEGRVATREGPDPVLARALTDAALEPRSGFLAVRGTTTGGTLVVPWTAGILTRVGADIDATRGELVATYGGVELRDRCNCVTLRANAAHRVGRSGVDAWLSLDFVANR